MYKYSYYICVAGLTIKISKKEYEEAKAYCLAHYKWTLITTDGLRFEYNSISGEHCYIGLYKI